MVFMSGLPAAFRVTYAQYGELREDIAEQMARGGLLVKVHDTPGLDFDSSVALELVLPDGTKLQSASKVLQIFAGFGVAVTVDAQLVEQVSQLASRPEVAPPGASRHERVEPAMPARPALRPRPHTPPPSYRRSPATTPPPLAAVRSRPDTTPPPLMIAPAARVKPPTAPPPFTELFAGLPTPTPTPPPPPATLPPSSSPAIEIPREPSAPAAAAAPEAPLAAAPGTAGLTRMEKVQKALHGTRDERNAILRDRDHTLHAFVLKNPQLDADDVIAIAKNPQMAPDMLQQIGDRKEWVQRASVALALARNPRTPPELAVRALQFVPFEALRQFAKGSGVPPHVCQAARKKLLG
jgi:hypothetical protein